MLTVKPGHVVVGITTESVRAVAKTLDRATMLFGARPKCISDGRWRQRTPVNLLCSSQDVVRALRAVGRRERRDDQFSHPTGPEPANH